MTAMFSIDHDFLMIADVCATLGVPQDDWCVVGLVAKPEDGLSCGPVTVRGRDGTAA